MRKSIIYIFGIVALLSSCTREKNPASAFLSGDGKTPVVVVSNVQANPAVTKAVDGAWNANDEFLAYIKHVTTTGSDPLVYAADVTGSGVGPRLANFRITGITQDHDNIADNFSEHTATSTLAVTDANGLYWDDFNNSASSDTDIRTSGHALMSYYGYCYNGSPAYGQSGTRITSNLVQATGVLGWSVATDQTSGFKTSDLLFSGQQIPVAYDHGSASGLSGRDRRISIPYTHAMSKVTIVLELGEGFSSGNTNFASTTVTLQGMNTAATVTAPTESLSAFGTSGNISAVGIVDGDSPNMKMSFSALIAPTVMKDGKLLAKIVNIDGNDYDLVLTHAALTTATSPKVAWNQKLGAHDAASVSVPGNVFVSGYTEANGGITLPGVHYVFTATIKKQEIKVEATINDWDTVDAEGYGSVQFANDVINKTGDISEGLKTNGFDIYKSANTTFDTKETTVSWDDVNKKWVYTPTVYWANSSDKSYFRALSGAIADDPATDSKNESLAMSQGRDVLWGTTAAHSGTDVNGNPYSYAKSDKIDPRTGNVPLEFEHAMSKVSFILKNADGIEEAAKVDLNGARISIINLYNGGTIDVNTGDISNLTLALTSPEIYTLEGDVTLTDGVYKLADQVVIPQSLVKNKDAADRDTAPSFYQSNELTAIYPEANSTYETVAPGETAHTSIGSGEAIYYLTSELERVEVVLFDAEGANAYNGNLPGARPAGYEEKYTDEEVIAYNAALPGAVKEGDEIPSPGDYSAEEAIAYNAKLTGAVKEGDAKPSPGEYTAEEAIAYNAKLTGAVKEGDAKPSPGEYTAEEAIAYNAKLTGAVKEGDAKPSPGEYTAEEAIAYNAALPDAVKEGDAKPDPEEGTYTAEEAIEHNAKLDGAVSAGEAKPSPGTYTADEAIAYNAGLTDAVSAGEAKPSPGTYTADEAIEYNAKLDGAVKEGDAKPSPGDYTAQEAIDYNEELEGAVHAGEAKPSPGNYTAEGAIEHNASLEGAISTDTTKNTYSADEANAYNAALPGAVKVGDVKVPAHYKLPSPAPTSHNAGDLKNAGNKIMLYITLADGSRYVIDLATCIDSGDNVITQWQRGKHYTYTISLQKEEITFRALIKDWVETSGGGNANLEWD